MTDYQPVYDKINAMMDKSYGCAEAFVAAVGEALWGEVDPAVQRIATGFSGGVGGTHEELCGGVSGAAIVAGLVYGRTTADEAQMIRCKRVVATHRDCFLARFGTTTCQELRDAEFGADERNPCSALIGPSAAILLDILRDEAAAEQAERRRETALHIPPVEAFRALHAEDDAAALLAELDTAELPHQHRAWIGERLAALGDPRPGVGLLPGGAPHLDWAPVSRGEITVERAGLFGVRPFYAARYLLTYQQYAAFLAAADGFADDRWWEGLAVDAEGRSAPGDGRFPLPNNPRDNISWYDAVACGRWLTARYQALVPDPACGETFNDVLRLIQREGWQIRPPAEWEWQQAAMGGEPQNRFPWGPEWDDGRAHTKHNQLDRAIAVGLYPAGASPCGLLDMSGNLWEWCLNAYDHPADQASGGAARRVLRGGSWYHWGSYAHTGMRLRYYPDQRTNAAGVRFVCVRG